MIVSFACEETEKIFLGVKSKRFPSHIQKSAYNKLLLIDIAASISELRFPPSHHLEKLQGQRKNQYSIRINQQFRICFYYQNGHALEVEITDYH